MGFSIQPKETLRVYSYVVLGSLTTMSWWTPRDTVSVEPSHPALFRVLLFKVPALTQACASAWVIFYFFIWQIPTYLSTFSLHIISSKKTSLVPIVSCPDGLRTLPLS